MKAQIATDIICPKCQEIMENHLSLDAKFHRTSCRNRSCGLFSVKFKLPTVELELEEE